MNITATKENKADEGRSIYNIVPIIVPFHDDLSVDFDSLKKHALFLRNNGIKSVVVGG